MKTRLFASILAAAMLLSMVGCSGDPSQSSTGPVSSASSAPAASSAAEGQIVIPSELPDPVVYTGSGDDVVTLDPFEGVWIMEITGNDQGRHFAVSGYDASGNSTELFVNTTDPYHGIVMDPYLKTETLEISATGDWKVEVKSAFELDTIASGETYSGSGDSVLLVMSSGKTAHIAGNADGRHFAVIAYGDSGDLLVNTTDPYDGKVMIKNDPVILVINAEGDWSITFD